MDNEEKMYWESTWYMNVMQLMNDQETQKRGKISNKPLLNSTETIVIVQK